MNEEKDTKLQAGAKGTIRYQWMLSRIQGMKSLLVATLLAMAGYTASAVGESETYCEISLLILGAVFLVLALVFAAMDAGAALFYNEKSQEGIGEKLRFAMYLFIALAAIVVLSAKIVRGVSNIETSSNASGQVATPSSSLELQKLRLCRPFPTR